MKLCPKCGRTYDLAAWLELPFVPCIVDGALVPGTRETSVMHTELDDGSPGETIVLRNCTCGSTLAVDASLEGPALAARAD